MNSTVLYGKTKDKVIYNFRKPVKRTRNSALRAKYLKKTQLKSRITQRPKKYTVYTEVGTFFQTIFDISLKSTRLQQNTVITTIKQAKAEDNNKICPA